MSRRIAFALACLTAPLLARAQATNPAADPSTSQTPEAARRAARDAIPLTPELIQELARRFQENKRAEEETLARIASPISRAVSHGVQRVGMLRTPKWRTSKRSG